MTWHSFKYYFFSVPEREDKPENIFYFQNIRCVNVKEQIKNKSLFLCYKSFG